MSDRNREQEKQEDQGGSLHGVPRGIESADQETFDGAPTWEPAAVKRSEYERRSRKRPRCYMESD
jgi:hypothetical protein